MFYFCVIAIRVCLVALTMQREKAKHHPPVKHRIQQPIFLQRRQPTVVTSPAAPRSTSAATNDRRRSIALQSSPQDRPFGVHPATDKHDCRNNGDQHDTEQNRIFDERSAVLVILELLDKLQRMTHVFLRFDLMHSALFAHSKREQ